MATKSPSSRSRRSLANGDAPAGRRIQARRSDVHGRGVFALQDLAPGETLIEYKGEVITWKEALRRHPHDPAQPNHTFYFHIDDKRVIDANVDGNAARWINHSCEPNCEADERGGRVFIKALRAIARGEELSYDYGLVIDEPHTDKLLAEFPCWCGSAQCRGTLLAPRDEDDAPERKSDKSGQKKRSGAGERKSGAPKDQGDAKTARAKDGKEKNSKGKGKKKDWRGDRRAQASDRRHAP